MAIPTYTSKGDFRRLLTVVAAIDEADGATLVQIVARTGIDKRSVQRFIDQANQQTDILITKNGALYKLTDWGRVIKREGALAALNGELSAPAEELAAKHFAAGTRNNPYNAKDVGYFMYEKMWEKLNDDTSHP